MVATNSFIKSCYDQLVAGGFTGSASGLLGDSIATQINALIDAATSTVNEVKLQVLSATPAPAGASWVSFSPATAGPVSPPASVPFTVTVNVPPGTPAGAYTFTIGGLADGADVGRQTLTVNVTNSQPDITINDVTVTEGDPPTLVPAGFTVSLSAPSAAPVTVQYATAPDTATNVPAPGDFAAATGTVTFAPGETTKPVVVQVKGDLTDEPDERFFVNLSAPTNGIVTDAQGIGTILDDERNGAFSCRATGVRLLGTELGVANGPNSPCKDGTQTVLGVNLNALGLVVVQSGTVNVATDQTPNDIQLTAPALGDNGLANAKLQGLRIKVLGVTITADVLSSTAKVQCVSPLGAMPGLNGSSQITNLRVNGTPVALANGTGTVTIAGVGKLHLGHQSIAGGVLTQRALWLQGTGLLSAVQVVVSEAKANFTGNPCDE